MSFMQIPILFKKYVHKGLSGVERVWEFLINASEDVYNKCMYILIKLFVLL